MISRKFGGKEGQWIQVVEVDWRDLVPYGSAANNSSNPLVLFTVPVGARVNLLGGYLLNNTGFTFSDAGINSLTMSVGDAGSATRYLNAVEIAQVASGKQNAFGAGAAYVYPSSGQVRAVFTAAGGASPTLGEAIGGTVRLLFEVTDLRLLGQR